MSAPRLPKLTEDQFARRRARWAASEATGDLVILEWAVRQIELPVTERDRAVDGLWRAVAVVDHVSTLLEWLEGGGSGAPASAREMAGPQAPAMTSSPSLPRPAAPEGEADALPAAGDALRALLASPEVQELAALTAPLPVDLPWASEIEAATAGILDALWAHPTHGEIARHVAQADLEQLARLVCGDRTRAREWLSETNRVLGGRTPVAVARESAAGLARVRRLLLRSMLAATAAHVRATQSPPPHAPPSAGATTAGAVALPRAGDAPARWTCPVCGAERPVRRGRTRSRLACGCRRAAIESDPSSGVLREIVCEPGDPDLPRSGRHS